MIWFGRSLTVLIGAFLGYMAGGMVGASWMYGLAFVGYLVMPHVLDHIVGALGILPYAGMVAGTLLGVALAAKVSRNFEWRGRREA